MLLRIIIIIILLLQDIKDIIEIYFINKQRKKPLPPEVSDIYDHDRYEKFLSYKHDTQRVSLVSRFIHFIPQAFFILSPYYQWIETFANGHILLIAFYTFIIEGVITSMIDFVINYYGQFHVDDKYGLNKQTFHDYVKDFFKDIIISTIMFIVLFGFIIFVAENIYQWLINFPHHILLAILIDLGILLVVIFISLASLLFLKLQYKFTDMPECQLKLDIENILKGCKKKVHRIMIYDESKKSISKNAFLLSLGFYREICIADNFVNENDHNELLAVLSHEVGHLRHQKDIFNYMTYCFSFLMIIIIDALIIHPQIVSTINQYICDSFQLQQTNYPLVISIFSLIMTQLMFFTNIYSNYRTRREEYEADLYAVQMGYGEELIHTFKSLSHDELVDVNPSNYIEFMYHNHPSMYHRIKAIREATKKRQVNLDR